MTKLEQLELQSGRVYTMNDWTRALMKKRDTPGELTDLDLALLGHFGGAEQECAAIQARTAALTPPPPVLPDVRKIDPPALATKAAGVTPAPDRKNILTELGRYGFTLKTLTADQCELLRKDPALTKQVGKLWEHVCIYRSMDRFIEKAVAPLREEIAAVLERCAASDQAQAQLTTTVQALTDRILELEAQAASRELVP